MDFIIIYVLYMYDRFSVGSYRILLIDKVAFIMYLNVLA